MVPDFEKYISVKGIQHLILAGLYGDVCVDATAGSAFQRGFWISIVEGCVGNLHSCLNDWEKFAGKVYGAKMPSVDKVAISNGVTDKAVAIKAKLV